MASGNPSVKQRLRALLADECPAAITEEVWASLLSRLGPVSESYLRDLSRCRPYTDSMWRKRPLKQRVMEWLLTPIRSEL